MKIRKFAAIDIGSNAIRLLTNNVIEEDGRETQFKKSQLIRVPVRLGEDAFTIGEIREHNIKRVVKTMKAFQLLMSVAGVEKYMACATSAMREASNGLALIQKVEEETGIKIELIDGKREAAIIASTDLKKLIKKENTYLYIDVGGGSTEFTFFSNGRMRVSKSFKLGTVRLLNHTVKQEIWNDLENWISDACNENERIVIIGSGGNINKLHKMSGRKEGQPLSYIWLNAQYNFLNELTYDEKISELGLNPDRADVIMPATKIFLFAAKLCNAKKIHVPKIGLSDGIIKTLYLQTKNE